MTSGRRLPDGFVVGLRDDVEPASAIIAGSSLLRLSAPALELLADRTLVVSSAPTAALADRLLDLDLAVPLPSAGEQPGLDGVTVVVPVRDNPVGLDRLLSRLDGRVPCVVVDDASADPVRLGDIAARHRATVVRLDHNVGPAAARTIGLRDVETPLVAFVDSDVVVSPATLRRLAGHFVDPGLAAAAPRVRSSGGTTWFARYDDACGSLDLGPESATVRPWSRVAYVPSACLVARAELLGDGFDPRLRSGEDVDLIWRLHDAGHRVRYDADAGASHTARPTMMAWLGRKAFYGASAGSLASRHGDKVAPAVLTPLGAAAAAAVLLQRRWSWAAALGLTAWQVRESSGRLPQLSPSQRAVVAGTTQVALARQTTGLVLRHWWPVSVVAASGSRRARRVLVILTVLDGIAARRSTGADLDLARFTAARRLDDLAYGAGVWWGAVRARSITCLLPRWTSTRGGRVEP